VRVSLLLSFLTIYEKGVSTKFAKVAKTSKGPFPQSFWISDVK